MKLLIKLISWDTILLHRNRLFIVSAIMLGFYIGIFHLLKPLGDLSVILVVIIFNDLIATGFIFGGVLILFDKNQHTLQALSVLPISHRHYMVSKTIVLTTLAILLATIITIWTKGFQAQWLHLIMGTLFSTIIFTQAGLAIGAISKNFNQFILYAVPFLLVGALPFLPIFGLGSRWLFCFMPSYGGLEILYASFNPSETGLITAGYLNLIIWSLISWFTADRITKQNWS